MKTTSVCYKRNLTNANGQKLNKAQRELRNIYQKEQKDILEFKSIKEEIMWKIDNHE